MYEYSEERIKIIAIGDKAVGKTSMIITYRRGEFPNYFPTTGFDPRGKMDYNGEVKDVEIWDSGD